MMLFTSFFEIDASLREAMSSSAKLLNPEGDMWVDKQLGGALHSIVNLFTPCQYPSKEVFCGFNLNKNVVHIVKDFYYGKDIVKPSPEPHPKREEA